MTDQHRADTRDTHSRVATEDRATQPTAVSRVKDKTGAARDAAADAARKTAQSIEANPIGILVGGLAFGAIAGALIPRSAQEKELLAPVGKTLGERVRAAFDAARETGRAELNELGLSRNAARNQVRGVVEGLVSVAQKAGAAAAKSATDPG